jgi:signal transduction histidine kinase
MRLWRWAHDRRTSFVVTFGTLLAIAVVYVVIVLGGGLLIGRTDSPNVPLSVLATALVALGLEPVRTWLTAVASERLDGGRRPPYDVLSGFTESLSDTGTESPGPVDLPTRLARHLAIGTGAAWSQVLLVVNGVLEPAATWPPGAETDRGPEDAAVHARDVVLDGEHLGTLLVREPEDASFGPIEQRLLADLAAQAGMVLHRSRLRAELARRATDLAVRAEELQESRRRLVDAHDAERQRLERDIHDGAQQHLVALVVNLRLAQTLAEKAPDRSRVVLAEQVAAVDAAIATVGDLARGLYPRTLVEHGVGPALREVSGGTGAAISVTDRVVGRLPDDIEAALYFCAVEAIQNAVKHARASAIAVDLASDGRLVSLEVRDDGCGFEPAAGSGGHGLGNMRDRVDAIQGTFALESVPGVGSTVIATAPVRLTAGQVAAS